MHSKKYSIGKVRTFDNFVGEIVAQDGNYLFTSENITQKEPLKINDVVLFRGEEINSIKRAYFIQSIDPQLKKEEIEQKIKKLEPDKKTL